MKNVMLNQLAPILNSEKEKIVCHFLIAFSFLRYFFIFFRQLGTVGNFFPSQLEAEKLAGSDKKKKKIISQREIFTAKRKKDAILLYTEDKINKFHCTRGQR